MCIDIYIHHLCIDIYIHQYQQIRCWRSSSASPPTLHSDPYTLRPTPYTLHPTPSPYTLNPTPYTPNRCWRSSNATPRTRSRRSGSFTRGSRREFAPRAVPVRSSRGRCAGVVVRVWARVQGSTRALRRRITGSVARYLQVRASWILLSRSALLPQFESE